jgi:hypothetical protein
MQLDANLDPERRSCEKKFKGQVENFKKNLNIPINGNFRENEK